MLGKRKHLNINLRKDNTKHKKHRIYNDLSSIPYFICEEKKEEKPDKLITKNIKMDNKELTDDEIYELYY